MKIVTLLLLLTTHQFAFAKKACIKSMDSSLPSVSHDIKDINLNNCIDTYFSFGFDSSQSEMKKATCDCTTQELEKFNLPKLPKKSKSAQMYQNILFDKAKINLIDISNDLSLLNSNPHFSQSNLGQTCSIDNLNITKCNFSDKRKAELKDLTCRFQKELSIQSGKDKNNLQNNGCSPLTDRSIDSNQYSCSDRVPEQMIAEIQFQKSILLLEKLQVNFNSPVTSFDSVTDLLSASAKTSEEKLLTKKLIGMIGKLPIFRNLVDNKEFISKLKNQIPIRELLKDQSLLQPEMVNMKDKCTNTYKNLETVLCSPSALSYPSDLDGYISALDEDESLDAKSVNQEIANYCQNKKYNFDNIKSELNERKSTEALAYKTFNEASKKVQRENVIKPAKNVCSSLFGTDKSASDEDVVLKINACKKNPNWIEIDSCQDLMAFNDLYGQAFKDQIKKNKIKLASAKNSKKTNSASTQGSSTSDDSSEETPSTFYQILNKDSNLLSSFRGDKLKIEPSVQTSQKTEVAQAPAQPAAPESKVTPPVTASAQAAPTTPVAAPTAATQETNNNLAMSDGRKTNYQSSQAFNNQRFSADESDSTNKTGKLLDRLTRDRKRRAEKSGSSRSPLGQEIDELRKKIAKNNSKTPKKKSYQSSKSNEELNTGEVESSSSANGFTDPAQVDSPKSQVTQTQQLAAPSNNGVQNTPSALTDAQKSEKSLNKALGQMANAKKQGAAVAARGPASVSAGASPISITRANTKDLNNPEGLAVLEVSNTLDEDLQVLVDHDLEEIDQIKSLVKEGKSFYISKRGSNNFKVLVEKSDDGFRIIPKGDKENPKFLRFVQEIKKSITVQKQFKNLFAGLEDMNTLFK